MPRGQYDRAAAKAKRAVPNDWERQPPYPRPAFPYENKPVMGYDVEADVVIPVTQAKYDGITAMAYKVAQERDALKAEIAKYAAVLKRNGLWLDE